MGLKPLGFRLPSQCYNWTSNQSATRMWPNRRSLVLSGPNACYFIVVKCLGHQSHADIREGLVTMRQHLCCLYFLGNRGSNSMLMSNTDQILRLLSHAGLQAVVVKIQALADQVHSMCSAIHEVM